MYILKDSLPSLLQRESTFLLLSFRSWKRLILSSSHGVRVRVIIPERENYCKNWKNSVMQMQYGKQIIIFDNAWTSDWHIVNWLNIDAIIYLWTSVNKQVSCKSIRQINAIFQRHSWPCGYIGEFLIRRNLQKNHKISWKIDDKYEST